MLSILARKPKSCCDKVSVFILVFNSMGTKLFDRDNCQWVQESWCVSFWFYYVQCFRWVLTTFTSFHAPHVPLTDLDFFTEHFQRKKKKKPIVGIRTHAHSFHGAVQLPLRCQVTLVEIRLNHTFNIQLILVFTVS